MNVKQKLKFKSIYAKFAVIFLVVWWGLNAITFSAIMRILSSSDFLKHQDFQYIHQLIGFVFLNSAFWGAIIILLVVRSIVRPIKELSAAAQEVAGGNFEVSVNANSADEIGRLTADFNVMVKELRSIDMLRRDFVSNVSHEFRTPITAIKGFAKLIAEDKGANEGTREYCKMMIAESDRLIDLSSNLLRLSELDSQIIHAQTTFSLDEQIRQTILFLQPNWEQKQIEFDLSLSKMEYTGDEDLLRQVWLNLIQNAIKFSQDEGTIKIHLQKCNDIVHIKVTDNGVGMASDEIPRIFDRFYKGNKSHKGTGNGLGLSIAKKIIEQAGGNISLDSDLGKGTTVTVELPIRTPK